MENLDHHFVDRRVLITGGVGFIGSWLARRLVQAGARVTLVDSLIPEYGGNLFNIRDIAERVKLNIADVRDENSMNYLVQGQEYIFNLAGQVSHIDSMTDPFTDLEINCRSQLSILEACRKNNPDTKVVFACTRQVYGRPEYLPVDERHPVHPTDVNGINNMAGEWYHILYNNVYGIRAVSLRLTNTYGPGLLMKHNRQGFVGWFVRQVLEGQEIQLFGDGGQQRDFNYVTDAVEAMLQVAISERANGQIYNLGGVRAVSLKEFVETLVELAGQGSYRLVPFPGEKKRIDIGDYYATYFKIKQEIGWEPRVDLREGLTAMVEYYKQHREYYW